ncbi:rab GTPase-activating protein 1-like [Cololabis saira]|uniref:rab GTPase-activating protein 1-like n=1 Tax=Cololabis saira TaxID=129043 RepID=UPI002AD54C58|nr:rab GTPase-activating protein 1-like [Cololabis saira]
MMQEMSTVMACDSHVVEEMSEEEILACLAAEIEPTFTVPTKKAKFKESRLQIMDDGDALDKYLRENRRLQQASLRLEQENDNLAHTLISSKVALRNALDKAEDRVDELTKDLLQTRHRLQDTEDEKRGKEEEAAMLKQVFRRELEKAEQEIKRSSGIIADYKQICSRLTLRMERQEAAHREELESLKRAIKTCSHCRGVAESNTAGHDSETAAGTESPELTEKSREERGADPTPGDQRSEDQEKKSLRAQIRELEHELAQTKLQMVEANCKIQEMEHHRGVLASDLQEARNSWISKAFTSLRTSSGGLVPRDGTPAGGWNLHSVSLNGWTNRKLLWPHRDNRENVSQPDTTGGSDLH